jgi:hypothetical protein
MEPTPASAPTPDPNDAADPRKNPYAPPKLPEPTTAARRRRWPYSYVVLYAVLQMVAMANDAGVYLRLVKIDIGFLVRIVAALIGLAWVSARWEGLPPRRRVVGGDYVSVGRFQGRHFIPIYGLIWMFRVQHALCDAIDDALDARSLRDRAPRALGVFACAAWILGRLGGSLGAPLYFGINGAIAVLWAAYMLDVEKTYALAFATPA